LSVVFFSSCKKNYTCNCYYWVQVYPNNSHDLRAETILFEYTSVTGHQAKKKCAAEVANVEKTYADPTAECGLSDSR
jgi:hypothetical protein